MTAQPFRWNLSRPEQLGRLLAVTTAENYRGFVADLRVTCARVVAAAGDRDIVFVGRSPESLFDYLSGLLSGTSWSERPVLLNVSVRGTTSSELKRTNPPAIAALKKQLDAIGLSPKRISKDAQSKAFIDLVYRGETFGNLANLLLEFAGTTEKDAVCRRIRFIGITERLKPSPNTWRWYQHAPWAKNFPRKALQSVSIPGHLWTYLGDSQKKVSRGYPPENWGREDFTRPRRETQALEALRCAYGVYQRACAKDERHAFAAELAAKPAMKDAWCRNLVLELRGG